MEINPRAAAIAELVLWIGFLQWHFRTRANPPSPPILQAFKNIQIKDAVLKADISLERDASGKPVAFRRFRSWGSVFEEPLCVGLASGGLARRGKRSAILEVPLL
jgi:hypothetical protein